MDGIRVVDRVRDALTRVAGEIVLSANADGAADWVPGLAVIPDLHPGTGGLSGVHAALDRAGGAGGADVLAVAWDMPFVTSELLALISGRFTATGAEACVPESDSPHGIEPFCACYSATLRAPLDAFLKGGGGSAHDFLSGRNVARIPLAETARLGDPARIFLSVNDPADLERARAGRR